MLSSKFKQLHIVDGYKFRFQKTLANGVQRWYHSKLNSMFYHSHPNIYLFLEAVQEIQTGNYIKINTAHTQRKVRRAKASVEKEYSIAQEMKRFTNREIDRLTCQISIKKIPSSKFVDQVRNL
uniref:Uncharacterized protein n=1 Tax=Cacopsylla melanoneura TaxID=428564 RepID=A0A8D8LQZ7_9HEMI